VLGFVCTNDHDLMLVTIINAFHM